MKIFFVLLLLAIPLIFQNGCSEENTQLSAPSNIYYTTDTLRVDLGSIFTITKVSYGCGRCSWEIWRQFDERYIEFQEYTIEYSGSGEIGGESITQTWRYLTKKQGKISSTIIQSCIGDTEIHGSEIILVIIE